MTTTYAAAKDEIYGALKTRWDALTLAVVGYVPEMRWHGSELPDKPDMSKYWARASIQTVIARQSGLARNVGQAQRSRYTNSGLVFVQIFAPRSDARGVELGEALAVIARDTYRGHTVRGEVSYYRARFEELPPEELAYRFNVVAEYEFDELG